MSRTYFGKAIESMKKAKVQGDAGIERFIYVDADDMNKGYLQKFDFIMYPEDAKEQIVECLTYFGIVHIVTKENHQENRYRIIVYPKAYSMSHN